MTQELVSRRLQRHAQPATTLLGVGTATPPHAPQTFARDFAMARCCDEPKQHDFLRRVYDNSGVRARGSVLIGGEARTADSEFGIPDSRFQISDLRSQISQISNPIPDTAHFESQVARFYPPRADAADRGPTTSARMHAYAEHAPSLAYESSRAALDAAALASSQITHLITVSCTGFFAPGLDACLINRLSLPRDVQRLQLGFMGCHGAFNALAEARRIAMACGRARVLVCCTELCTLHFAYGFDPQRIVANALFADGSSAVVVGRSNSDTQHYRVSDAASLLIPDAPEAMTWNIGDHGFEMTLSPNLPDVIRKHLSPWIAAFLGRNGLSIRDVTQFAIHPGGPRILTAAEDALGLEEPALSVSRQVLADHGNMSSATILFVLNELRRQDRAGPCLAIGFGPGLMAEAMLLR